jgi:hypothetical protein
VKSPSAPLPEASTRHSNADLFLWALALAGGRDGYVDIEDVYWKCFELAPKRFGWRTRPEIPDLQKISVARRDAIKKQAAAGVELIAAQEADVRVGRPVPAYNWRLTALGSEWIEANASRLNRLYGGGAVPAPPRRADEARLRSIRTSSTFQTWQSEGEVKAEIWELADLLECSPASPSEVWRLRLDSLQIASDSDGNDELLGFVAALRNKLKGTVLR